MRNRHGDEIRAVLLRALETEDWVLSGTARRLDVQVSSVQRLLERYPELERRRLRVLAAKRDNVAA